MFSTTIANKKSAGEALFSSGQFAGTLQAFCGMLQDHMIKTLYLKYINNNIYQLVHLLSISKFHC